MPSKLDCAVTTASASPTASRSSCGNSPPLNDPVVWDNPAAFEIGFAVPERYNASDILFQNTVPERASRIAILGPADELTYAQLCTNAARWGNALLSLGLSRGERVVFLLDDSLSCPAAFFGAVRAGFVPVLLNILTPPDQLRFCIQDSGARVAITDRISLERFGTPPAFSLETLIVIDEQLDSSAWPTVKATGQWVRHFSGDLAPADTHRNDMAFWMYSSGSTGRPKAIVHLQHDIAYTQASYGKNVLRLSPDDRCFSTAKIFFSYGFGNSITFPFSVGASSLLIPGRSSSETVFNVIARYHPTVFFGVPTLYASLVHSPEIARADLSSLRLAVSAAEPLPPKIADAWRSCTGIEIVDCLGATELLNVYISNTPEMNRRGSVGRRVPGYEIALKDENGVDVPDGQEGTMWIRGHSSTPLYWNAPAQTAETILPDGWIRTKDRFVRDRDGFYFYRGRADDLVKVSGQWVHPLEVQNCLASHPSVRECAVVPFNESNDCKGLMAYVVLDETKQPATVRTLKDYVKRRLLPHKSPRVIRFVNSLPKTGTGKIDRQALLESSKKGGNVQYAFQGTQLSQTRDSSKENLNENWDSST